MWQTVVIWAVTIALCWGLLWLVIRLGKRRRDGNRQKFRLIQGGKK